MMVLCGLQKQRVMKAVIRRPGRALGGEGQGVLKIGFVVRR